VRSRRPLRRDPPPANHARSRQRDPTGTHRPSLPPQPPRLAPLAASDPRTRRRSAAQSRTPPSSTANISHPIDSQHERSVPYRPAAAGHARVNTRARLPNPRRAPRNSPQARISALGRESGSTAALSQPKARGANRLRTRCKRLSGESATALPNLQLSGHRTCMTGVGVSRQRRRHPPGPALRLPRVCRTQPAIPLPCADCGAVRARWGSAPSRSVSPTLALHDPRRSRIELPGDRAPHRSLRRIRVAAAATGRLPEPAQPPAATRAMSRGGRRNRSRRCSAVRCRRTPVAAGDRRRRRA
jgi:hypothetical protein